MIGGSKSQESRVEVRLFAKPNSQIYLTNLRKPLFNSLSLSPSHSPRGIIVVHASPRALHMTRSCRVASNPWKHWSAWHKTDNIVCTMLVPYQQQVLVLYSLQASIKHAPMPVSQKNTKHWNRRAQHGMAHKMPPVEDDMIFRYLISFGLQAGNQNKMVNLKCYSSSQRISKLFLTSIYTYIKKNIFDQEP